ncbi:hypothetical protein RRF57_009307 [Xylaria bambusicola]|uniref:Ornithine cyclodeaminase n=1 Tax=Xylaria bambusicola TaxID=326684 RepID=A0AAN7ZBW0_9PEZI
MRSIDPSHSDYQDCLKGYLSTADAIFCTVGSTEPLFPASYVLSEGRKRQPYVSAVGSWQPDMIELDPELLHQTVKGISSGSRAGSVLADDRKYVLEHSGEFARSKIGAENVVEIGEIENLQDSETDKEPLENWMKDGLLVYKSVGVGLTDLAASNAIMAIAKQRQLGTTISQF